MSQKRLLVILGSVLLVVVAVGAVTGKGLTAPRATAAPVIAYPVYDLGGQPDYAVAIDYMSETEDCEGLADLLDRAMQRGMTERFREYIAMGIAVTDCQ